MPIRRRATIQAVAAALTALVAAGVVSGCHNGGTAAARPTASGPSGSRTALPATPTRPPSDDSPPPQSPSITPASAMPTSVHGMPPVISSVPTKDKVVFITIDDGWEKDADFLQLIRDQRIPITTFLMNDAIRNNYDYYRELQEAGALIEDHTMTHPYLPGLSYARQKEQICQAADILGRQYGTRPTLMRAPYGATNHNTLQAAKDCGIRALFFWREVAAFGRIAYQTSGGLHPGDILLVHFNPHMTADFRRMLANIEHQGFRPAAFKDYLPASYFG
jgi:peptidoglycan/xylan/chitin deacetylase (PgdA/CDA1 family)